MSPSDWDRYWRYELFRRRADPLDFRRWKRDSQRALKQLYRGAPLLLDSTAGLGDHTVNLAEEGFVVEACDTSSVAREATRQAVRDAGLDVEVFDAPWQALGRDGRYDLIFNDALHWTYDEDTLRAELRGLFQALLPGGALVYFFAEADDPAPDAGARVLAWDWEHMERERVAWEHTLDEVSVRLTIRAERGEDFIDEHHLFRERLADGTEREERLTMRRVYRWDWYHLTPLLEDVGFVGIVSGRFENRAKGYTFAMNRAHRPA
jgi:SAM-dependent methyltransferase